MRKTHDSSTVRLEWVNKMRFEKRAFNAFYEKKKPKILSFIEKPYI